MTSPPARCHAAAAAAIARGSSGPDPDEGLGAQWAEAVSYDSGFHVYVNRVTGEQTTPV